MGMLSSWICLPVITMEPVALPLMAKPNRQASKTNAEIRCLRTKWMGEDMGFP